MVLFLGILMNIVLLIIIIKFDKIFIIGFLVLFLLVVQLMKIYYK